MLNIRTKYTTLGDFLCEFTDGIKLYNTDPLFRTMIDSMWTFDIFDIFECINHLLSIINHQKEMMVDIVENQPKQIVINQTVVDRLLKENDKLTTELNDVYLLKYYMKGFNNELYGIVEEVDDKYKVAYDLGCLHALIGDDMPSLDDMTDEVILKLIKDLIDENKKR